MLDSEVSRRARKVLSGGSGAEPRELIALARALVVENEFGYARRILAAAASSPEVQDDRNLLRSVLLRQAQSTYKDPELSAGSRTERALEILGSIEDLATTRDQEILGLTGAIYKQQFQVYARTQYLERALAYYSRGYEQGIQSDYGYTAINCAFVLDLLASLEQREADAARTVSETAALRRRRAERIREEVLLVLVPLTYSGDLLGAPWLAATLAEAAFGLRRYDEAQRWLEMARAAERGVHEQESIARQLITLARINNVDLREFPRILQALGMGAAATFSAAVGKIGLALSGGGFRAALFHIGVLARLAEIDALRDIEVISCVNGGSIVGAYYYLEVQNLLEAKPDHEITREDYIQIVRRLESDMLAGIQRNLRVRSYANLWENLKTLFVPGYTRANRLGELLEREIFARVRGDRADRYMGDLVIHPFGERRGFSPKFDNWRRNAKVPYLIINATTLNTARNWQFTASWMGEPPSGDAENIDHLDRFRRMYYEEAPPRYRRVRLGTAVAASACTPGLFDPVSFPGLYPGFTLRLVDGGVHDNQGLAAVLDQDCTLAIVADATANISTIRNAPAGMLDVVIRSNSILMSRVRAAQYRELVMRRHASLLRGLVSLHLKKDLDSESIDWVDATDPLPHLSRSPFTSYGMRKDVQLRLSEIRSDLDAFHDVEAYALMTSGYLMTKYECARQVEGFDDVPPGDWRFLVVEESLRSVQRSEVLRLLEVSRSRAFKIFRLAPLLVLPFLLLLLALAWGLLFSVHVLPLKQLAWVAAVLSIILLIPMALGRDPLSIMTAAAIAVAGPVAAWFHLWLINPIYLARGHLSAEPTRHVAERATQFTGERRTSDRIVSRSEHVDSISRVLELAGYSVVRFPRDQESNPLKADVDIVAKKEQRFCYVKVVSPEAAVRAVDWIAASEVKRGVWSVSGQNNVPLKKVTPMVVLVDVQADESLLAFCREEHVTLVTCTATSVHAALSSGDPSVARELLDLPL